MLRGTWHLHGTVLRGSVFLLLERDRERWRKRERERKRERVKYCSSLERWKELSKALYSHMHIHSLF